MIRSPRDSTVEAINDPHLWRLLVDAPSFPLPLGHMFGANVRDLRYHDGRAGFRDGQALKTWQGAYRSRIKRDLEVTGVYDRATQSAVVAVQRLAGLDPTGRLDSATWAAVWTVEQPARPKPPEAPALPTRPKKTYRHTKQSWRYWRKYSTMDLDYTRNGPDDPPWYPGRPFGPNEVGFHVREFQAKIGARPTGHFNKALALQVRGLRKAADLPVCDFVDIQLARYVDPGPYVGEPPRGSGEALVTVEAAASTTTLG